MRKTKYPSLLFTSLLPIPIPLSSEHLLFSLTQVCVEDHLEKGSTLIKGIALLSELQQNAHTNKYRTSLLVEPIASLPCYSEAPDVSGFAGPLRLAVILCRYLRGATHVLGYPLPDCWIDALCETTCWLTAMLQLYHEGSRIASKRFSCSFPLLGFPSITQYLPDMELVSVGNW